MSAAWAAVASARAANAVETVKAIFFMIIPLQLTNPGLTRDDKRLLPLWR